MPSQLEMFRSRAQTLTVERAAPLSTDTVDLEAGTFSAVLATDTPIKSPLGPLVLSHARGAPTFPANAPVLIGHAANQLPVGRWSQIQITRTHGEETSSTVATARIGTRHRDTILRDVAEGTITDVSVGAEVNLDAVEERSDGTLVANDWTLREASLVGLAADPSATIMRTESMPDATPSAPAAHAERVAQIKQIFTGLEGPDWLAHRVEALESTDTVDVIRDRVVDKLKSLASKEAPRPPVSDEKLDAKIERDATDKFLDGFKQALEFKTGLVPHDQQREKERELRRSEFLSMSLYDVARQWLSQTNTPVAGLSRDQIAHRALFTRAGDGFAGYMPGDLTQVLASNVNMAMSRGYDEADESWMAWTGRDQAPDFKQAHRPVLSAFSGLNQITGTGEYTWGDVSDKEETFTLETWGRLFGIGRQAIVNDSLSVFGRIPRAMGRAASRKVGDEVYLVLNLTSPSPATMSEDSVALFHTATHSNYVASGSGAAISVATLNTARTSMATQTDVDGSTTISIRPRWLITSEASVTTAETIVAATKNPVTASGEEPMPGWIGGLMVTSDHRIDSDVSTAWYLAADPGQHDTVLVAFLDGISTPTLEQHDPDPSRDGVIYKVRHDFVAYPADWRTLYANYGA